LEVQNQNIIKGIIIKGILAGDQADFLKKWSDSVSHLPNRDYRN
jgi:hypothetical protein